MWQHNSRPDGIGHSLKMLCRNYVRRKIFSNSPDGLEARAGGHLRQRVTINGAFLQIGFPPHLIFFSPPNKPKQRFGSANELGTPL